MHLHRNVSYGEQFCLFGYGDLRFCAFGYCPFRLPLLYSPKRVPPMVCRPAYCQAMQA